MSRWFRFYDDAINDPKLLKLSDKTYRVWMGMLCLASKHEGKLPPFDDMALLLRMKPDKLQPELEKLIEAGLLDHSDAGIEPHNWNGRQYKSDTSNERVKRYRQRSCNVTVTPPDTEQKQITETDQKDCADAPIDPSIAEREYFARGREVLGPKAGSLLGKLLNFKGKNVALARAVIEEASQKSNAHEWVGAHLRGPPAVRVTTAFQQSRAETKDILNDLDDYANGRSSGSETDFGVLPGYSGERQQGIRGGTRPALIDISPRSRQTGG